MTSPNEKKERVIHTRLPESLDEELRKRAERLGVSVSNLVRNALRHTFGLVEDVITDSAQVARSARGEAVSPSPLAPVSAPGAVLGWQEARLNLNAVCHRCNTILTKGSSAAIGVVQGPTQRPIICLDCLEEVTS